MLPSATTNHILYSVVFCKTLYFWITSKQETGLSVRHLGRDLRDVETQAESESW